MGGVCSSAAVEATLMVVESEIFDMLEELVKVNVLLALDYIDEWMKKNITDDDFNRLNTLKTKAVKQVIEEKKQIVDPAVEQNKE